MIDPQQGPTWIVTAAVWGYWFGVLVMSVRVRMQGAGSAGLFPAQPIERLMWVVWVPVITGWIVFPWLSITQNGPIWQLHQGVSGQALWATLRWTAASISVICLLATVFCWRWMGQNWRVGVAAGEETRLITDGPFSRVRHPIYALSMLMMIATLVAVPTLPMLIVAVMHIILMNLKARNEEVWMAHRHGREYETYLLRSSRFIPRLR